MKLMKIQYHLWLHISEYFSSVSRTLVYSAAHPEKRFGEIKFEYRWFIREGIRGVCELPRKRLKIIGVEVLLAYFAEKSKTLTSSTLWSLCSTQIRAGYKNNVGIIFKLTAFMENKSIGYKSNKFRLLRISYIACMLKRWTKYKIIINFNSISSTCNYEFRRYMYLRRAHS